MCLVSFKDIGGNPFTFPTLRVFWSLSAVAGWLVSKIPQLICSHESPAHDSLLYMNQNTSKKKGGSCARLYTTGPSPWPKIMLFSRTHSHDHVWPHLASIQHGNACSGYSRGQLGFPNASTCATSTVLPWGPLRLVVPKQA